MVKENGFWVRFWGVRGTIATPGLATFRYGGNTACVEVCCSGTRLIFDAGTGIRELGEEAFRENKPLSMHILFTHTHLDHIIGLPFFRPAYHGGNRFQLWNGHLRQQGMTLQGTLNRLMEAPYFPVPLGILQACIAFHDFDAGETIEPLPGVRIRTVPLNHPGGATGYRIDHKGRSLCHITDVEHGENGPDASLMDLVAGSDLVIYDATYTDEEYQHYRGWGHSTWQEGVRLCKAGGARRLVTFHHDPNRDDDALDRIAAELDHAMPGSLVAREGLVIEL